MASENIMNLDDLARHPCPCTASGPWSTSTPARVAARRREAQSPGCTEPARRPREDWKSVMAPRART
jgi:hypothetical protein